MGKSQNVPDLEVKVRENHPVGCTNRGDFDGRSYRRGRGHETKPGSIAAEMCEHEPDIETLRLPQDVHPETSDGHIELIIDVVCSKCGTSGYFAVTVSPEDINWHGYSQGARR